MAVEYISRKEALNFAMEIEADPDEIQAITKGMALYAEYIKSIPTAKVEARKTGKWIFKKPPDDWIMSLYMCDQCHHWEEGKPNFCPNCGADMRGEA